MLPRPDPREFAPLILHAKVLADSVQSGLHAAATRGSALEFAEYKIYTPGDDVRRIDWRASARQDRTYVREREHEAELDVTLVLDASPSMTFASGAWSKLQFAATLLATIAQLAVRQHDRVGLAIIGATAPRIPHRNTRTHVEGIIASLEAIALKPPPAQTEPLGEQLHAALAEHGRRRGLCIVASDFFDPSESLVRVLRVAGAGHLDIGAWHVLDPSELTFPYDGMTRFDAMESDEKLLVDASVVRAAYLARLQQFLAGLQGAFLQAGLQYQRAVVGDSITHLVREFLAARARAP